MDYRDQYNVVVDKTWSNYNQNLLHIQVCSLEGLQYNLVDKNKWQLHYDFCILRSYHMEMDCKDQ